MAEPENTKKLKKNLSLLNLYAIAVGATLSSGFFLLPGLAAEQAGPAVIVAYMIALLPLIPGILSVVELSTAMPRAGGVYYFLDRSVGPSLGTVGGIGTLLALVLKVAFALVGMGAYLSLLWPAIDIKPVAAGLAIVFGLINWFGTGKTGGFQVVLVAGLLAILTVFMILCAPQVEASSFDGFFEEGPRSILATAGLVCVSFIGLTKVASVSEEVADPERTLPRAIFLAVFTAIVVYVLGTTVMVGVLGDDLVSDANVLTPVAGTAFAAVGEWGKILMTVAAVLAFFSVANAGILSASRYPMAMSRDRLMPAMFQRLGRHDTPTAAIIFTVVLVVGIVLLVDPLQIAKLAGAFQLLLFAMCCVAVIIMRESRIESYQPGYHVPLYPWLQIIGIIAPFVLIVEMGWVPISFSAGLILLGLVWYWAYARRRVTRRGAIYRLFDRLGERRFDDLDVELRTILKEKGLRRDDPFDEVVARAQVVDMDADHTFEEVVAQVAPMMADRVPAGAEELQSGFLEGTRTGATPVTGGIALPHMRVPGVEQPQMVIVRCVRGVAIETPFAPSSDEPTVQTYAIFFLISAESDPGLHLRILAQLATRVDEPEFLRDWVEAPSPQHLKDLLLGEHNLLRLHLAAGSPTSGLCGRTVRDIQLPEGCLVAVVLRDGKPFIPRGRTVLEDGDMLTVIGEDEVLAGLRREYLPESG